LGTSLPGWLNTIDYPIVRCLKLHSFSQNSFQQMAVLVEQAVQRTTH
jgi:hypothetical protein